MPFNKVQTNISFYNLKNSIMKKLFFFMIAVTSFFISCKQNQATSNEGIDTFNKDSLVQHVKILASDSFQGRKPFTLGETKTIDYLQKVFKRLGLEPGNGDSYLQDVPLVNITAQPEAIMKVESAKGNFELKKYDDFVVFTQKTDTVISLKNAEVVFAGYGVVAPEYNWNDYEGLDVKGKVVLVMVNDPGFGVDTTLFKGNTMTYYGRWTYKYEEAARQGAKACFVIHNTEAASYPFSVVQSSNSGSRLFLDERNSPGKPHLDLNGWISADATKKILAAAGKDTSLLLSANKRGFKPILLNEKFSLNVKVKAEYNTSHNVIGKITGSKRPDEYVIYAAHWDHLGIGKPDKKGDSIYNGALDNASGTAGLIEIARAFKNLKEKPERSILFLAVTAEEQGLLGSAYYAAHPIYPINKTAAALNMDGVNPFEKTNDFGIAGQGQNDLEDYAIEAAKKQNRYLAPETHSEAGYYFRSDHFNFAKMGIPALFNRFGIDVVGKGKEYGLKIDNDYTANRYHQPADEYDSTWTFEGGIQDLQMLFMIGKKIAYESTFPQWKEGSEFKAIRDKN